MPKKAEEAMRRTAQKRGYGEKRTDAYVYGGLRNTGWRPSGQGMLTRRAPRSR